MKRNGPTFGDFCPPKILEVFVQLVPKPKLFLLFSSTLLDTVDDSEIRLTTWDGHKTIANNGINTDKLPRINYHG